MSGPYTTRDALRDASPGLDDTTAFGKMRAKRGDRCSNPGFDDHFTSPCCYADFDGKRNTCPECGAPIVCETEKQPVAVCRIADADEEDDDDQI